MNFMLMIYEAKGAFDGPGGPALIESIVARHRELAEALAAAKVDYTGSRLAPPASAAIVRTGAGDRKSRHDGPYAETREHLAGYYRVDVADLDEAVRWAERIPMPPGGVVEVRPCF